MSNATTASQWKASAQQGVEIQVPSGNIALVRAPGGMQTFLKQGKLPQALMPMVQKALKTGDAPDPEKLQEDLMSDEGLAMLEQMTAFMFEVVVDTTIQPEVHPIPLPKQEEDGTESPAPPRDPELLYIDEVQLDDVVFLFNYQMGGTKDLERFREQHAGSVEALAAVEGASSSTE